MSVNTEILSALSSAFRTGYDVGHSDGYWTGVAVVVLAHILAKILFDLLPWWRQRRKDAAARAVFAAFERGLPAPTRPAPPMPACKPPPKAP